VNNQLSKTELAFLCQSVENTVVGSPCGFMDQITCVHGVKDHLLSLLCRNAPNPSFHQIAWPDELQLFAIDSGVTRSTSSSTYARIRNAAFIGRAMIEDRHRMTDLCQIPLSEFNENYRFVLPDIVHGDQVLNTRLWDSSLTIQKNMKYPVRAATTHPIEEHARSRLFEKLLTRPQNSYCRSDFIHLGELMLQSNAGYSNCDLQTVETKQIIRLIREHESFGNFIFGAKMTGGGGGGSIAVLAKKEAKSQEILEGIIQDYQKKCNKQARL
jgi:galactokinase